MVSVVLRLISKKYSFFYKLYFIKGVNAGDMVFIV